MHCVRRTALRAALSASTQVAPKTAGPSIVLSALRVAGSVQSQLASRPFSQTVRAQDEFDNLNGAQPRKVQSRSDFVGSETEHGVFVRNMPFSLTTDQLKASFEKYGTVIGASVARENNGLSKGFGFVYFETAEQADEAIKEVDGSFWHGRRVNAAKRMNTSRREEGRPAEPSDTLFVGNIPYDTTDADLNQLFKDLPNLVDIRVAVDRTTGWPRGFAHVTFSDVESAGAAREKLNEHELGDRRLRVDFAARKDNNDAGRRNYDAGRRNNRSESERGGY